MKNLETRMKELAFSAYKLLSIPNININRSIFVEGVIHLDNLINYIILYYFFGYLKEGKIYLTAHAKDFEKNVLYNSDVDFEYNKKLELLKRCRIITKPKFNELKKIGEDRNKAAHRMGMHFGGEVNGWFKGSEKERKSTKSITELITTDDDVEEYKKKFADCYAYLFFKVIYLRSPGIEDLDPDGEDLKNKKNPKIKN